MKQAFFLLVAESLLTLASASLRCSSSSPRSPRDRKTKSPGSFGSDCSSPVPLESPRLVKRKKTVSINEATDYREYSPECFDREYFAASDAEDNEKAEIEEEKGKGIKSTVQEVTSIDDLEESPPSITSVFKVIETPRPILRKRLTVSKRHPTTIHLFRNGNDEEILKFYNQGTQLGASGAVVDEMFKYLIETGQVSKLKIIYARDKSKFLDFVIKSRGPSEIRTLDVLELAPFIFEGSEELILEFQAIAMANVDSYALRAAFFLHAVKFETSAVYKTLNDLIDDSSNDLGSLKMAKELLQRYNSSPEPREPLLIYAAKNDSEEAFMSILAFEPSEIDRLDGEGASVVFHAAQTGNIGVLESIKNAFGCGRPISIAGICPLIGAATANRDDSLKFFLEDYPDCFIFSSKDIEDAAFASATAGNIKILRMLLKNTGLNMHCYRGAETLLSTSLKNDQAGYAQQLVERMNYDVNFVGDDPVNPAGHALAYALGKYGTIELFLKKGANRNVLVPDINTNGISSSSSSYIPLAEYLQKCEDQKMIKIFNKYS